MSKEKFNGESLVGERFGKWTVIKHLGLKVTSHYKNIRLKHGRISTMKQRFYLCKCECGFQKEVSMGNLKSGRSKACRSCGHINIDCDTRHPLNRTYRAMILRCYNKNDKNYSHYGGRGIKVYKRWLGKKGFLNFCNDMGQKPTAKHSLDRINNDGNYEPNNCRWADWITQSNNKRYSSAKVLNATKLARLTGFSTEWVRCLTVKGDKPLEKFLVENKKTSFKTHRIYSNEAINFLNSNNL